ncbi:hypothetical protein KIH41_16265 [Litoribacter ruber]|uniref:MauE/DoxX family redox-associated membrane protein n=1 Tax=Litoribacter ruber TaxID=702568 RepID=UPI001BDAA5B3|nr:MauE/DoxX family redox-associated membrane protein [Litoribacter ruber]MBT0812842.1 hypothetical protein [Litoribacter ruber]
MRRYQIISEVLVMLLSGMFLYTAISKLLDFEKTRLALENQVFPLWMAEGLLYGLPIFEFGAVVLLLIPQLRYIGFWFSLVLMTVFTGYILAVMMGVFDRVPCSCGGVIDSLSWVEHLGFNVVFMGLAGVGLMLSGGGCRMTDVG